jgi:hypothetical protein
MDQTLDFLNALFFGVAEGEVKEQEQGARYGEQISGRRHMAMFESGFDSKYNFFEAVMPGGHCSNPLNFLPKISRCYA